jgi:hypothetical protein
VPKKDMPKEVSIMGGCPVPNLCSPLLLLAELEAEGKAKAPRLRAQQRGRVAKGKKLRRRRLLRYLWDKALGPKVCRPSLRPHTSSSIHSPAQARRSERSGESNHIMRQLPPEKEAR